MPFTKNRSVRARSSNLAISRGPFKGENHGLSQNVETERDRERTQDLEGKVEGENKNEITNREQEIELIGLIFPLYSTTEA